MKAELIPDNGDPPITITRDVTVVGRRDADVVIDHPSMSKRHCVLVKTDGLLVIRDLITTNGTKVKGQKIRWAALLPGDRIAFGGYKLRVYLGPDDAMAPSELYLRRAGKVAELKQAKEALREADPKQPQRFGSFAAPSLEDMPSSASFDDLAPPPSGESSAGHAFVDDDSIIDLD
ncbi:FHA domain-containing protein [Paludisphaera mucosa]|uniref:FHA domain-containing protein n=1 Tax=Paludisphaera mucosa TaxID=3030827 RepID=A0ABT6FFX1_9BACT|nr:FHA domain-containing protein [Paludisphaera mucosa]MDG3006468.1 FHA domain-containing protein [Paludisphaera mucosa]